MESDAEPAGTRVRRNDDRSRYEILVGERVVGFADYRRQGDVAVFPHTVIDADRRGRGLGAVLVRSALDDVRAEGLSVVPQCWYVREFIEDNPDYEDLLAA